MDEMNTKLEFLYLCSVRTKTMIKKGVRKQSFLALKSTSLGKNRLKNLVLIWYTYVLCIYYSLGTVSITHLLNNSLYK